MKAEWAAAGYGPDRIEVWAAAGPGMVFLAPGWLGGSTSPAFEDMTNAVGMSTGSELFDILVLDRELVVQKRWNTVFSSFSLKNLQDRAELDALVRSLL
jgi:hypothetical protein